jgi:site-specific DNA recombinase
MIAAVYARKSTSQAGRDEADKSVAHQVVVARAFATERGWTIDDAHVYVDDGISGAEFEEGRDGLRRLLEALRGRHRSFEVLLLTDKDRLGREQYETAYVLKKIDEAGVEVWEVNYARRINLDSPIDRFLVSAMGFAAEMERGQASIRTASKFRQKAEAGHVTGGRCYGYDNVEVKTASGKRQHVVRHINEAEADVVRRIFGLVAEGAGFKRIAKALNAEGVAPPRHAQGWAPTAIREIVHRSVYRGEMVWNRTQKRDQWGKKKYLPRPESEWLCRAVPDLRIVEPALWDAAHARLARTRETYVRGASGRVVLGRPAERDLESPYLLGGIARCAACGSTLQAMTRGGKRQGRLALYGCGYYHNRGKTVCKNSLTIRQEALDTAILDAIAEALDERIVARAIAIAMERLGGSQEAGQDRRRNLERQLAEVGTSKANLLATVKRGLATDDLLRELEVESQRERKFTRELETLDRGRKTPEDPKALERDLVARMSDLRGLLGRHVGQTRQILRRLLVGKLECEPFDDGERRGYRITGEGSYAELMPPAIRSECVVAPTGFEPVF